MARSRYTTVLGRRYILIRPRTLLPTVAIDLVGFALRRLLQPRPSTTPVERILAMRLDHIGDVLITTPALRLLRNTHPRARLDVLAGSWAADLLRDDPDVDRVITFDASWFGGGAGIGELVRLIHRLRHERYDLVLDFRGDLRHLIMARLIGARRIHGYGIRGGGFLVTEPTPYDDKSHEVERAAVLVHRRDSSRDDIGGLEISLRAEDVDKATSLYREVGIDGTRLIVGLCPASRNPTRLWQGHKFAEVARHLVERYDAQVLVFGETEAAAADVLSAHIPSVYSLVGKTSLRVFAAALARVDLIVSVESSPIHFASALEKPIVTVFGGSSLPEHWGPYGTRHRIVHRAVPCSPCHQLRCPLPRVLCMEEISAADVMRACDDLVLELAQSNRGLADKLPVAALE